MVALFKENARSSTNIFAKLHCVILPRKNCVHDEHDWMLRSNLKLNGDKAEMLVIGTRQQHAKVQGVSIKIDGDTIEPKDEARNSSVIFYKHKTLKVHVNAVCKSARYYLNDVNAARRYLTTEATEKAIHAFVVSRIDGTNSLLYGRLAIELKHSKPLWLGF